MDELPPKPPRLRPKQPQATPPPPPPPPVASVAASSEPEPAPHEAPAIVVVPEEKGLIRRRFTKSVEWEGLLSSLFVHILLLILATVWVVSVSNDARDPNSFVTGAGGGRQGTATTQHAVRPQGPKTLSKSVTRIASKSPEALIALPDAGDNTHSLLAGSAAAMSKGFGGGIGGGSGLSKGVGIGGKSFKGKPVMGMRINATRIAVYLDCSWSMIPFLDGAEKQIKQQFPNADVFRYFGIFTRVENGEVMGSTLNKKFEEDTVEQIYQQRKGRHTDPQWTNPNKLSPTGRGIFNMRDAQFRIGGVGAWTDYMMGQHYDALVIFSDFEDGIQQWRGVKGARPQLVFDADLKGGDDRTAAEKAWEGRWRTQFAKGPDGKAPKLYLFTTEMDPQPLWKECAEISGGEIKKVVLGKKGF